jgi:predicted ATPase
MLRGWAMAMENEGEEGIAEMRRGLTAWTSAGLVCLQPYFLSLLCEGYAAIGQTADALCVVDEALGITDRTHEGYVWADLWRLKGELQRDPAAAEASFRQAIAIARQQAAKSLERRAVVSLGRRLQTQGRHAEARAMLSDIQGWFTEGFDTSDAKDAAALLGSL